jgi:hypothetical protein
VPQSRSGRRGEEKILDPTGTRTPTPHSSSPYPVAIPTTLSRLLLIREVRVINYFQEFLIIVTLRRFVDFYGNEFFNTRRCGSTVI